MTSLLQNYLDQFIVFVLVLTRISGLVMTAPIFGSRSIPYRIRGLLAVALSMIITSLYWEHQVPVPQGIIEMALMLMREGVLGVLLGMSLQILFSGLQLAGQIISQMSGMSLADVFDPTFNQSVPIFAQLLETMVLSFFVAIGGHRLLIRALLETFRWRPPGVHELPTGIVAAVTDVVHQSFLMGIRAGAPVMVALLMAILMLGLISRTLPQLNVIAIGFSLNSMVMMLTLALSLGAIAWVLQEQAESVIERMTEVVIGI
jgi:flagellar biosynthetic protein FliR